MRIAAITFAVFAAVLLTACSTQKEGNMQTLTTEDNKQIAYSFYPAAKGTGGTGAVLLHQLRKDRHDFDVFGPKLRDAGFSVIAIDVRGHGESDGNWQQFSNADFQKVGLDIAAAKEFLKQQGADTKKLLL